MLQTMVPVTRESRNNMIIDQSVNLTDFKFAENSDQGYLRLNPSAPQSNMTSQALGGSGQRQSAMHQALGFTPKEHKDL